MNPRQCFHVLLVLLAAATVLPTTHAQGTHDVTLHMGDDWPEAGEFMATLYDLNGDPHQTVYFMASDLTSGVVFNDVPAGAAQVLVFTNDTTPRILLMAWADEVKGNQQIEVETDVPRGTEIKPSFDPETHLFRIGEEVEIDVNLEDLNEDALDRTTSIKLTINDTSEEELFVNQTNPDGRKHTFQFQVPTTKDHQVTLTVETHYGTDITFHGTLAIAVAQDCPPETARLVIPSNLQEYGVAEGPCMYDDDRTQFSARLSDYSKTLERALDDMSLAGVSEQGVYRAFDDYASSRSGDGELNWLYSTITSLKDSGAATKAYPTGQELLDLQAMLGRADADVETTFQTALEPIYAGHEETLQTARLVHLGTFFIGTVTLLVPLAVGVPLAIRWKGKMAAYGGYRASYQTLHPLPVLIILGGAGFILALIVAFAFPEQGLATHLRAIFNR